MLLKITDFERIIIKLKLMLFTCRDWSIQHINNYRNSSGYMGNVFVKICSI